MTEISLRAVAALLAALLVPAVVAGGGSAAERELAFAVSASPAKVSTFFSSKLVVHVHCVAPCDVDLQLRFSSASARRMGMLSFRNPPAIGTASAKAHPAGDFDLVVSPANDAADVQAALGFALFKALPVRIVATSNLGESSSSTSLTWPKQRAERGGHGNGPFIKSITGPRRVSLRSRFATFRVRIERIPGARFFTALVLTPGMHYTSGAPDALPDSVADSGGTFTIKVPIRSARGRADAAKLAPLAAELSLGLATKRQGDSAIHRFTLVK